MLAAAFRKIDPAEIEAWVRSEPTGAYSRRAWFLYETLTGTRLELDDVSAGSYVPALNPDLEFVAERRNSPRHRVIDNLLGGAGMCVSVRRTARLAEHAAARTDEEAKRLVAGFDQTTLSRAVSYLYTKETRSSFAIEGESPSPNRAERFVASLRDAPNFDLGDKASFVDLQRQIVESRYASLDWRDHQNFVGETISGYREKLHFICPRPGDVPQLITAWMAMAQRLIGSDVDPVIAAAAIAFAFVFIHPFEDGNGRLHRFLIHSVLARRGFSPPGIVFPVSASIVRSRHLYDEALESFSKPLFEFIDWHFDDETELVVENETAHLYRYFDATALAEYLYDRVVDTVRHDLAEELGYVAVFDRALAGVREIVDMPDRRATLFVRLCMQNGGRLSNTKRSTFSELDDDEIRRLERSVQEAIRQERTLHPGIMESEGS
ncbi:Fic family protein [Vulgatibacter incomptus]|uniref:Filamentation induced by cAMP protein Fic n=1 Tax=Vulgatibacter incomptus TaxID=1391653 RepID=A0A0K1PHS4_9BACT|nr:Fic family protein [Vulgatibacter incomptus]AKU93075.1 Filamentation induced by cAMP protein Fic [Vulgatibacter incomptus]